MNRIIIIGNSGSGKSTLAKELAVRLNLPLIHLDKLFWRDNWQHISRDEFDDLLLSELKKERWIIDGNFGRTIPLRLQYCDSVIYLDYPRGTCIFGVLKRVITGYGRTRSDMGDNCPERFDFKFLKFVWNFNQKNRRRYHEMLNAQNDKNIIVLHNRKECAAFLQNILYRT